MLCSGSSITNAVSFCPVMALALVGGMGKGLDAWCPPRRCVTADDLGVTGPAAESGAKRGAFPKSGRCVGSGRPPPIVPRGLKYPLNIAQALFS
jgi:hypothetical protein